MENNGTGQKDTPEGQAEAFLNNLLEKAVKYISQSYKERQDKLGVFAEAMWQFAQAAEKLPVPEDVECRAGCAFCCHNHVTTSIPEVLVIAQQLRDNLPPDVLTELVRKLSVLAEEGDINRREWWHETKTPCPFLGTAEGLLCSLYEIRPFTCRSHHSLSVAECKEGFESGSSSEILCYPVLRRGVDLYSVAFVRAMREQGLFSYQVSFISALILALKDATIASRWLNGEDAFKSCKVTL